MRPMPARALMGALLTALTVATPACAQSERPAATTAARGAALTADSVAERASRSRMRGPENAPITIYEFSDYQCPFCGEFERNTFPALDSAYLRTGKAKLIFLNFPLQTHPNAWPAAEAALCAGAQDRFWPMHDRLFALQKEWSGLDRPGPVFQGYARDLGLDMSAYDTCTREDQVSRVLVQDLTFGASGGVTGTPTFVLLREPRPGEQPQQAQRVFSGAQPLASFEKAIGELMK